jgi:hypothetical protein
MLAIASKAAAYSTFQLTNAFAARNCFDVFVRRLTW